MQMHLQFPHLSALKGRADSLPCMHGAPWPHGCNPYPTPSILQYVIPVMQSSSCLLAYLLLHVHVTPPACRCSSPPTPDGCYQLLEGSLWAVHSWVDLQQAGVLLIYHSRASQILLIRGRVCCVCSRSGSLLTSVSALCRGIADWWVRCA
jgi:hypothetical protein